MKNGRLPNKKRIVVFFICIGILFSQVTAQTQSEIKPLWTQKFEKIQDFSISGNGECIAIATNKNVSLFNNSGDVIYVFSPDWAKETIGSLDISYDCEFLAIGVLDPMFLRNNFYLVNKTGDVLWKKTYDQINLYPLFLDISSKQVSGGSVTSVAIGIKKMTGETSFLVLNKQGQKIWAPIWTPVDIRKISADGRYLVTSCIAIQERGRVDPLIYVIQDCLDIAISPDGKYIAVGSLNDYVYVFDTAAALLWKYKTEGDVFNVLITTKEDGFDITAVSRDKNIYYLTQGGDLIEKNKITGIFDVAFSSIGNYIKIDRYGDAERVSYYETERIAKIRGQNKPKIVLLANSIDYNLASEFFGFLENRGIKVIHATASEFEQYKNEKFIVILGGPDAPEGVGDIVQEVLMNSEQDQLREKGSRNMFVKTNLWIQRQSVMVIAGYDREQTKQAHEENGGNVVGKAK